MQKAEPVAPDLDRLELSVNRLLASLQQWVERARAAEERVRELEAAVQDIANGTLDPVALAAEVRLLEARNRKLTKRITSAHETVDRILARLQFAEEER